MSQAPVGHGAGPAEAAGRGRAGPANLDLGDPALCWDKTSDNLKKTEAFRAWFELPGAVHDTGPLPIHNVGRLVYGLKCTTDEVPEAIYVDGSVDDFQYITTKGFEICPELTEDVDKYGVFNGPDSYYDCAICPSLNRAFARRLTCTRSPEDVVVPAHVFRAAHDEAMEHGMLTDDHRFRFANIIYHLLRFANLSPKFFGKVAGMISEYLTTPNQARDVPTVVDGVAFTALIKDSLRKFASSDDVRQEIETLMDVDAKVWNSQVTVFLNPIVKAFPGDHVPTPVMMNATATMQHNENGILVDQWEGGGGIFEACPGADTPRAVSQTCNRLAGATCIAPRFMVMCQPVIPVMRSIQAVLCSLFTHAAIPNCAISWVTCPRYAINLTEGTWDNDGVFMIGVVTTPEYRIESEVYRRLVSCIFTDERDPKPVATPAIDYFGTPVPCLVVLPPVGVCKEAHPSLPEQTSMFRYAAASGHMMSLHPKVSVKLDTGPTKFGKLLPAISVEKDKDKERILPFGLMSSPYVPGCRPISLGFHYMSGTAIELTKPAGSPECSLPTLDKLTKETNHTLSIVNSLARGEGGQTGMWAILHRYEKPILDIYRGAGARPCWRSLSLGESFMRINLSGEFRLLYPTFGPRVVRMAEFVSILPDRDGNYWPGLAAFGFPVERWHKLILLKYGIPDDDDTAGQAEEPEPTPDRKKKAARSAIPQGPPAKGPLLAQGAQDKDAGRPSRGTRAERVEAKKAAHKGVSVKQRNDNVSAILDLAGDIAQSISLMETHLAAAKKKLERLTSMALASSMDRDGADEESAIESSEEEEEKPTAAGTKSAHARQALTTRPRQVGVFIREESRDLKPGEVPQERGYELQVDDYSDSEIPQERLQATRQHEERKARDVRQARGQHSAVPPPASLTVFQRPRKGKWQAPDPARLKACLTRTEFSLAQKYPQEEDETDDDYLTRIRVMRDSMRRP